MLHVDVEAVRGRRAGGRGVDNLDVRAHLASTAPRSVAFTSNESYNFALNEEPAGA
jgi:hypothetical protein